MAAPTLDEDVLKLVFDIVSHPLTRDDLEQLVEADAENYSLTDHGVENVYTRPELEAKQ